MRFSHIPIPREHHPTAAAIASLSRRLGFQPNDEIQDWERYFADPDRIGEFLDLYSNGNLDTEEKYLLMDLVLASAIDAEGDTPKRLQWATIERTLIADYDIHRWTVWYWAGIDEETGIAYNDHRISRRMQVLLVQQFEAEQKHLGKQAAKPELPTDGPFSAFWQLHFPGHLPAGFCMRKSLHERWIRIHALPASKRYAETEAEREILLHRANALAQAVLGENEICWLVVSRADNDPIKNDEPALESFDFNPAFAWSEEEGFDPLENMVAHAAECQWNAGQFDHLLLRIAAFEEPITFWVSQTTRAIFSPYDGGFDIILPDSSRVAAFKADHKDWLPDNLIGL